MNIAIVGGGIAGLSLALNLHQRGIDCTVYEAVREVRELGVGITLLPHATRELAALGLLERAAAAGIENRSSAFYTRFGQRIYAEPRGLSSGGAFPEIGIHRGRLHSILWQAAQERLGAERLQLGRRLVGFEQSASDVTLLFEGGAQAHADALLACDGVNSAVRRIFLPAEGLAFTGINTWRGVAHRHPILDGRTYFRIGSIKTAKMVIYPIADLKDGSGRQLINWTAEISGSADRKNDWNKPGRADDFLHYYDSWRFDWLDVPELVRSSLALFEYPMVDRDPISRWTHGRVTLVGDAAHPMYPRGSNGAAQALIDARTLADCLSGEPTTEAALTEYETLRREPTSRLVLTNRSNPPDVINIRVEELTADKPFTNLDDYISQDELRALSDNYKRIAGFDAKSLQHG